MRWSLLALLSLVASPAAAQLTRAATPGDAPPAATLADVAWIAGRWAGRQEDGVFASETYSPPAGGQITGHFFEARDGRVTLMELLQIVERGGSLVYRLRHFRPDFTGWEDASGQPREFALVAIDRDHAWFDGLTLDRSDPRTLVVAVMVTGKDGATREIAYRYPR